MSTSLGLPNVITHTNVHACLMSLQEDCHSKPIKATKFIFHTCILLGSKIEQKKYYIKNKEKIKDRIIKIPL